MDLLETQGYRGLYVLMDRVDEPSLLSVSEELMRQFVERLLDIKLLQYPRLGLKLFLPIEMDTIHRNAAPEQLKHMRLDKSNLIEQLKWSGQELYEIASHACGCAKPRPIPSSCPTCSKKVSISLPAGHPDHAGNPPVCLRLFVHPDHRLRQGIAQRSAGIRSALENLPLAVRSGAGLVDRPLRRPAADPELTG